MKHTKVYLLACLFLFVCSAFAQKQATYTNPVIPGDLADPSIIRIGNIYYATATSSEWAPFYPVFESKDLINWKQTGHIFEQQPAWTSSSFWAPELFYYRNKVYAYYTARNKAGISYIGVATANSPTQPFTDHGLIVEFGKEAIDAFILEDNGELYISWKAYGLDNRPIELLGCKLSNDGLRLDGEPFTLMRDDERIGMEGQDWFKKGAYYYMLYSVKSCCGPKSDYEVYVARSKNLKGPYEKYDGNPILHGGDEILSCGHGTLTTTPDGRMFYFFHAYLTGKHFYNGRQNMLQEMTIDENNWPRFTSGSAAVLENPVPFKNTRQQLVTSFSDNFKKKKLAVDWSWNYPYSTPQITTGKGVLQLSGTPKEGHKNGTALCVRPPLSDYIYQTQVCNQNNSLKGLTLYGDSENLLVFGCQNDKLILKEVRNGQTNVLSEQELPSLYLHLYIEVTEGYKCNFFWSTDGEDWQALDGNLSPRDFSHLVRWDRVARPGLIHDGPLNEPAEFRYFKLQKMLFFRPVIVF